MQGQRADVQGPEMNGIKIQRNILSSQASHTHSWRTPPQLGLLGLNTGLMPNWRGALSTCMQEAPGEGLLNQRPVGVQSVLRVCLFGGEAGWVRS